MIVLNSHYCVSFSHCLGQVFLYNTFTDSNSLNKWIKKTTDNACYYCSLSKGRTTVLNTNNNVLVFSV